jgi:hypothetical protein
MHICKRVSTHTDLGRDFKGGVGMAGKLLSLHEVLLVLGLRHLRAQFVVRVWVFVANTHTHALTHTHTHPERTKLQDLHIVDA